MATLEIIAGAAHQSVELWEDEELLIGRASYCDLTIERPQVSRTHARIMFRSDRYYVVDQASHYGTRINGANVHAYALTHGAVITLGHGVKLRFSDELEFLAPAPPSMRCPPVELAVGVLDPSARAERCRALLRSGTRWPVARAS